MKRGFISLTILLCFALIPVASAEILFSQPDDLYNFGEKLSVAIELRPNSETTDFFIVDIACGSERTQLYHVPYSLTAGESQSVDLNVKLYESIIGNVSGDCFLEGFFGTEVVKSQSFEISRLIELEANTDKSTYYPGDEVFVFGTANLKNGLPFDGFIELFVDSTNLSVISSVTGGEFNATLTLPDNVAPGDKNLKIRAYQKDNSGDIINEGDVMEKFNIKTVIKKLDVEFVSQDIIPGEENLKFKVKLYDQAGNEVSESVHVKIASPEKEIIFESTIKSLEDIEIPTFANYSVGYWKFESFMDDISVERLIYFEENDEIDFRLDNDTLVVTNIGNVGYNKEIVITIGNTTLTEVLDLKVGETKRFRLKAPDDQYDIKIQAGDSEVLANNVGLTGRAIDIGEIGSGKMLSFSIVGLLVIILGIVLFIVAIYKRRKNKRSTAPIVKSGEIGKGGVSVVSSSAPSVFVGGKKEDATVIALKIKSPVREETNVINDSLSMAKNKGARVYLSEDFRLMVFSTTLTKSLNNEVLAVKVAKEISEMFDAHNKKTRNKVDYGIGVNSGQVVTEIHSGEVKITSLGSLTSGAKNLADISKSNVLVSDKVHVRLSGEIKTQASIGKLKAWQVTRILDRQQHNKFIDDFQSKQKK